MEQLTTVTAVDELGERELAAFPVTGKRIAIAKVDEAFYAFGDTCTHQGCSLAEGELDGTTVTCPCHGSEFDVTTGEVLRGPAREPVRSYPVRVEDGLLRVEACRPGPQWKGPSSRSGVSSRSSCGSIPSGPAHRRSPGIRPRRCPPRS
jgi:nitrite reductase/ring-hydroxylating ferredoxin subunit